MDNAQLITVTVEVSNDIEPTAVVEALNGALSGTERGYWVGSTAGTPAHAVEGEPYRAGTPGQDVYVGTVTLVQ